jgi:DNA invertase Pin-like site-specific DNA recombinase
MNRAALFARSNHRTRLEGQLALCRQTAQEKGLPLEGASVVRDRSRRGTDLIERRPAFAQLLQNVRTGRCELVVASELMVLTADIEEFAELLRLVRVGALRIVTADGIDIGRLS